MKNLANPINPTCLIPACLREEAALPASDGVITVNSWRPYGVLCVSATSLRPFKVSGNELRKCKEHGLVYRTCAKNAELTFKKG